MLGYTMFHPGFVNKGKPVVRTRRTEITMNKPSTLADGTIENMKNQTHLLIAGCTGSGKSVVINDIIAHIMSEFPSENKDTGAKMVLIDPKRVELCQYKNLPHTLLYASEPEQMYQALLYAERKMEERYKQMQSRGERVFSGGHLYVIIDELADLMTTDKKRVTPVLQRLFQLGRAAKVHLFCATQRPTSEVIPTRLTVNCDSRVALHCARPQDSRNIIDQTGAELLPKYGYALYSTPERGVRKIAIPMYKQSKVDALLDHWSYYDDTTGQLGYENNDIGDLRKGFRGE